MLKSCGWVGGWWVAHKIFVTSPEAKFFFPFLGPRLWTGTWPWACQYWEYSQICLKSARSNLQGPLVLVLGRKGMGPGLEKKTNIKPEIFFYENSTRIIINMVLFALYNW